MGMKPADVAGQFVGQDQGLAESTDAVGRSVASEIADPRGARPCVTGAVARGPPGPKDPPGFLVQVFRQVGDGRPDFLVNGVDGRVGGVAEREQPDVEPQTFQAQDLLGDEGLRQSRIALENEGDTRTGTDTFAQIRVHLRSFA